MKISEISDPRQVVLVTSKAEVEDQFSPEKIIKENIFTVAWHMPISFDPPLYAISAAKERYSSKLIKESKVFTVNFISANMEKEALLCGTSSGENIDKFNITGIEKEDTDNIDCIRIKDSIGFLECSVVQEIDAGDHIIFIGKVLNMKLDKEQDEQKKRLFQDKDRFTTTR